ncbi:hypothetical protein BS78_K266400 [Paspalum vaginatum]|uniref:F-ATPase protein 6 n=2 Tax=Paspalum vaginatum TaxID=158149 RepID=A0A9W7XB38_9POAL|nr:hypothetical protein BS78_K266400 [Paspalum vaginatum]WRO39378.1 ATP synthase F0 subunit 6 [Paspalum vaginatum]
MRLSLTDMKDRNMLFAASKPNHICIRGMSGGSGDQPLSRIDLPLKSSPELLEEERYLYSVMDSVVSYMHETGRILPPGMYEQCFYRRLFTDYFSAPGSLSFRSIVEDFQANGVANSRLGTILRSLYDNAYGAPNPNNAIVFTPAVPPRSNQSPLNQFEIHPIMDLDLGNFYFSFTNLSLYMLITLGFVLLMIFVVTKKGGGKSVPNAWQSLVELIYDFVPNLVNEQIGGLSGNVKQKFFPCISVTFTFSLFRNPQGMIPFSFTVTSHFLITLALSFSIFIGITIVGFQRHGLHFFSFLLPAGVPLPLAPFLVLLELISHCFRALSSGIRLFANMMAGHSSVKILSGFAWTMLFMNNIFYFIGDLGPLFIVLALTGLELGVAISQAHVSTISICIYLNDATNLHQNESFHNCIKMRSQELHMV